jgi:hypothetical protein
VSAVLALLVAVISALYAVRARRRSNLPTRAVIVSPRRSAVSDADGVRSVQAADFTLDADDLDRLWNSTNLERLGRTYWRFLTRVTLGLIRVVYAENERRVVLLFRPLTLLRFDTPDYVMEADHGAVSWRIKDGLLVAKAGRGSGFLAVDVRRRPSGDDGKAMLHIEVEVANFYPSIAAGFSLPVYSVTQSFIHVLVTHAFLRSLATLHLYESKVGRFASDSVPMPDEVSDGGVSAAEPAAPEAPGITAGQASSRHP